MTETPYRPVRLYQQVAEKLIRAMARKAAQRHRFAVGARLSRH